ncbi:MAG: hypothetical protein EA425_16920 [Puniceicoccaceae bacterium]|nr:MAG: hypothetical protein EA425_16920 [Puniceicoccaceae bacterium]
MSAAPADLNTLREALGRQALFEGKTWRLSPAAWPLTPEQVGHIEAIGRACFEFQQALETLYQRSASDRNLLRNRPLKAPWVADYLDRGKPPHLRELARDARLRGIHAPVLRPDLLLTEEGFALTEIDSVPGGIGLTGFLNRLYRSPANADIIGEDDLMLTHFYRSLARLAPNPGNPVIAIVVSEEASTYRPEMQWLADELQHQGRRVHCLAPEQIFPLGGALFLDVEGDPVKIDVIYRFFELFDLPNIPGQEHILEAWEAGEVVVSPPLKTYSEEKLGLALFHHHRLRDFWEENLSREARRTLAGIVPKSWILDPTPLPPGAVLDGPPVGGRPPADWLELAEASQKERDLILKISGFHETAWGARSVLLGSDVSRTVWRAGLEAALSQAGDHPHVLQEFRKPRRVRHPLFADDGSSAPREGRLRLCPYFFVEDNGPVLSGILATFCPPDKKIIHGMQDAALLPCRRSGD